MSVVWIAVYDLLTPEQRISYAAQVKRYDCLVMSWPWEFIKYLVMVNFMITFGFKSARQTVRDKNAQILLRPGIDIHFHFASKYSFSHFLCKHSIWLGVHRARHKIKVKIFILFLEKPQNVRDFYFRKWKFSALFEMLRCFVAQYTFEGESWFGICLKNLCIIELIFSKSIKAPLTGLVRKKYGAVENMEDATSFAKGDTEKAKKMMV